MSELPIIKKEYEKAALMINFIAKMRDSLELNDTVKFTPLNNGYKIDFLLDDKQINILLDLKKRIKTKLIVNVFVNEIAEKSFISVSYACLYNKRKARRQRLWWDKSSWPVSCPDVCAMRQDVWHRVRGHVCFPCPRDR